MTGNRKSMQRLGVLPWVGYVVVYLAVISAMGLA
jgi:hypothetical protein